MRTITTILATVLLISLGFNVWQYLHPREIKTEPKIVYVPNEADKAPTVVTTLPAGNQSATVQVIKEYITKTERAKELLKTVKSIPDLESQKQITSLIQTQMQLEMQLSEKDMALNDLQKNVKTWKDKYNSVTVDNATNNVSVSSEVSPLIATTEKREKFYLPKEQYTTVTSENPAVKFYGMESYTFKNPAQKDFLELNIKAQGIFFGAEIIPYGGVELIFNPDGKIKPIVGYGYLYDSNKEKFIQYWLGGLQFNLIRF